MERRNTIRSESDGVSSWLDILDDDRALRAVYRGEVPTLQGIDLHEIRLHRDGPSLSLRFDLADYPGNPPKKWRSQNLNTVQVELTFGPLRSVLIDRFSLRPIVNLSLIKESDLIDVLIDSDQVKISALAECVMLRSMTAYTNIERQAGI
jgi:hypothetical protein